MSNGHTKADWFCSWRDNDKCTKLIKFRTKTHNEKIFSLDFRIRVSISTEWTLGPGWTAWYKSIGHRQNEQSKCKTNEVQRDVKCVRRTQYSYSDCRQQCHNNLLDVCVYIYSFVRLVCSFMTWIWLSRFCGETTDTSNNNNNTVEHSVLLCI